MTPDAAERMRVYQEGRKSSTDDNAVCPYKAGDWRVLTWIKGRQAAQNYWREVEEIENRIAEQKQAEPVVKREPLTEVELQDLLLAIDPHTKRLPYGFYLFARAIEKAHGIGEEE